METRINAIVIIQIQVITLLDFLFVRISIM
jgi:hypothetical protein